MKTVFRLSLGIILTLMGLAGLLLPFMPGIIFIIIGLTLLGSKNRLIVKVKRLIRQRFYRSDSAFKTKYSLRQGRNLMKKTLIIAGVILLVVLLIVGGLL